MSQIVNKARSLEEKEKWKQAAQEFQKAFYAFQEEGKTKEAKDAIQKAVENIRKTDEIELSLEILEDYTQIYRKKTNAGYITDILQPLEKMILKAEEKDDVDELIDLYQKKALFVENTRGETKEIKKKLANCYLTKAFDNLTHRRESKRTESFDYLQKASVIFDEVVDKKQRIESKHRAIKELMENGYIEKGLELFEQVMAYCQAEEMREEAINILQTIIGYGKGVLFSEGPKKLQKNAAKLLSAKNPGGALFDRALIKAREFEAKDIIIQVANSYAEFAQTKMDKKKYAQGENNYNQALKLFIEVEAKDLAKQLAEEISEKAYKLLNQKGTYDKGLQLFNILDQLRKIDQPLIAKIFAEKADYLFTNSYFSLANEEYQKATQTFLDAGDIKQFHQVITKMVEKTFILINKQSFDLVYQYIQNIAKFLEENQSYQEMGSHLTSLAVALIKARQIEKAEDYSVKAVESLIKEKDISGAAKSHQEVGVALLDINEFDLASFHLVESATLYKNVELEEEIESCFSALLNAAKNQLNAGDIETAKEILTAAAKAAHQKDVFAEANMHIEFAEHAIKNSDYSLALGKMITAKNLIRDLKPEMMVELANKMIQISRELIEQQNQFNLGLEYAQNAFQGLSLIDQNIEAADYAFEISELLLQKEHKEQAKDLLNQISNLLDKQKTPAEYAKRVTLVGKKLIQNKFYDDGLDNLRLAVHSFIAQANKKPVIDLANYCSSKAQLVLEQEENIPAKYLYLAAIEFASLVELEKLDTILIDATNRFLEVHDLYTVKEFYDYVKNNLEGEKDYLAKLGRLIVVQGAMVRDNLQQNEDALDFIQRGITILKEINLPSEAGEAALAQGKVFIEQDKFIIGEELIETGAEIFIEANDIERSGDAFLALTEMNLKRNQWQDANRQIDLAIKSYQKAKTVKKLTTAIYQKAEIGSVALIDDPEQQIDFAKKCFKSAHKSAEKNNLGSLEIDIYLLQARTYSKIDDLPNSYNYYQTATQLLEENDEKDKSPLVAEEITILATTIFPDDEIELGLQLVDLATRIYMRLEKPIKTSEVYMKACNALLKINRVVEAVKLVLLASDTLMVAEEYGNAADILEEIIDLLFEMKDYTHASICTGQIVTVHQKTGDTKQQTKAISKLVAKANKLISEGMIKEGEELWEQASSYSISVSLEFAKQTYTQRIDNLLQVGMYNSVNIAFQQFITILEDNDKELVVQGNKLASIASELLTKNEFDLAKDFVLTAVDFYSKANELESAKNLCLSMSESLINQGDDKNGIELIDTAARIANENKGAHNAALVYVNSGFILIESGYLESGTIAIDKAIEIELKANNISGCAELGNITMKKGAEIAQNDPNRAIDVYILAAKIFDKAGSKKKAGEASVIISTYYMNDGNAREAMIHSENAVDYFLEENNIDSAVAATKHALESARRFLTDNDFPNAVHILERGRVLVEKIGQFDLLSLIISLYLTASKQNLPNRKSAIGVFFLRRALDLVNSHPEPEEIKKVTQLAIQLALEVIKKKNALAGAKVLEIISSQPVAREVMVEEVSFAFIDALKHTIDNEWNRIAKVLKDAVNYFQEINKLDMVGELIEIITNRSNADLMLSKSQMGLYFLDQAINTARKVAIPELIVQIGNDCFEQAVVLSSEVNLDISYQLLGYAYQLYQEVGSLENIERVGKEFLKLGSKDILQDLNSIRGYESLLIARDIAIKTQNEEIFCDVLLALLDFAKRSLDQNVDSTFLTLKDIVEGLEAYEIPSSQRATINYEQIADPVKELISFGTKRTKSEKTYTLGKKIVELVYRMLALTNNEAELEDEIEKTKKDLQKIFRRSNRDGAYELRHSAIILDDLHKPEEATDIAEKTIRHAQSLAERKKYRESIYFTDAAIKICQKLSLQTELKNLGLFSVNTANRISREGKIPESMSFYNFAVEAFDYAEDEEGSNRLINMVLQQREWDADPVIVFQAYKIAVESAVRRKKYQKAQEMATKCFNRGIANLDQQRIPLELSFEYIDLAGKTLEDIGYIKQAANAYDNALLKMTKIISSRKNVESFISELLIRIAVNRMASCDMDSLETIYIRVNELTELKKTKVAKTVAKILKLINSSKVREAWDLVASMPYVSHGRIRKIIDSTKAVIINELEKKGSFDRTIFSTTERSQPLSDYILKSLVITNKVVGQSVNRDVFLAENKVVAIRNYFFEEFEMWGRVEIESILNQFQINQMDAISLIKRNFLPMIYMGVLDNNQRIFYSFERLKEELKLIINREKKKDAIFDPLSIASEIKISPDTIKEVLREVNCEEVVEKALVS